MIETSFTPYSGLFGGILIGLSSAALLLTSGKIAGISGILGRSLFPSRGDLSWRMSFLVGLPPGALLATKFAPGSFSITDDPVLLVAGGLLVGVGTQLGNGCTSGHGVCGMARGSVRSVVATLTFMTTAGLTVFVVRHVAGGAS